MLNTLKIIFTYCIGRFGSLLGLRFDSSLAVRKLDATSFNLPEKHRHSYRSVLSGIKLLFAVSVKENQKDSRSKTLIYDVTKASEKVRTEFLNFYGISEEFTFTSSKEFLYYISSIDKLCFILFTLPINFHLLIYGLLKKDRSGLNSIPTNLLVTRNFIRYCLIHKVKKIYMFSIYDTNSAFLSKCLMNIGLSVSQITSEVPLYKWNKIIIANELILCSEYQKLEIEKFKDTMSYSKFSLFGPEMFYKIGNLYLNPTQKNKKIGFYSTGGWVRNKLGHMDQGTNMEGNENRILTELNVLLGERKDLELIIYPHPREKEFFGGSEKALYDFYKTLIPDITFEINKKNQPVNELFDDVYLAICYMTTLIFERAHAKRPSLIAYFKERDFPLQKNFDYLSIIDTKEDLRKKIELNFA